MKERIVYAAGLVLLLFIVGFVGKSYVNKPADIVFEKQSDAASAPASQPQTEMQVHVAGCVVKPGLYKLSGDPRVSDALQAAGGAKPEADLEQLNLAAKVVDGTQLFVPAKAKVEPEKVAEPYQGGPKSAVVQTYSSHPVDVHPSSGGHKNPSPNSISLNSASLSQLQQLPGVGPATAQKILDYRQEHGGFSSVEELMAVKGIGPKKMENMRRFLKL